MVVTVPRQKRTVGGRARSYRQRVAPYAAQAALEKKQKRGERLVLSLHRNKTLYAGSDDEVEVTQPPASKVVPDAAVPCNSVEGSISCCFVIALFWRILSPCVLDSDDEEDPYEYPEESLEDEEDAQLPVQHFIADQAEEVGSDEEEEDSEGGSDGEEESEGEEEEENDGGATTDGDG